MQSITPSLLGPLDSSTAVSLIQHVSRNSRIQDLHGSSTHTNPQSSNNTAAAQILHHRRRDSEIALLPASTLPDSNDTASGTPENQERMPPIFPGSSAISREIAPLLTEHEADLELQKRLTSRLRDRTAKLKTIRDTIQGVQNNVQNLLDELMEIVASTDTQAERE